MNDFICFNDWFTEKYQEKSGVRFWSFKVALNILLQRGGTNIVETGTIRMKDDWGGGMSTLLLGDFCKHYDKHLWTVDIDPNAIEVCKEITADFKDHITYVVSDSIAFLKGFDQKIDFLYLDSLDCPEYLEANSPDLIVTQQHQLNELKAAWDKLTDNPVVLLDDNRWENGGKTKLTNAFLKEKGWLCLIDYQQSLWVKK